MTIDFIDCPSLPSGWCLNVVTAKRVARTLAITDQIHHARLTPDTDLGTILNPSATLIASVHACRPNGSPIQTCLNSSTS